MPDPNTPTPQPGGDPAPAPSPEPVPAPPAPASTESPPAPQPAPPAPAAAPPAPAPAPPPADGGSPVTMSSRQLKERLERAEVSAADKRARQLGYATWEEMEADLARLKAPPAPAATPPAPAAAPAAPASTSPGQPGEPVVSEREKELARQNRKLKRQLDASQARAAVERVAVSVGIKDVDYAVVLLNRALEGKSEAELGAFDHKKFFENLRAPHPYLFGEAVVPMNTGTGAGAPPAPPPGPVARGQGVEGNPDAMKMSRQEYEAYLQKRGINPLGVGN